MAKKNGMGFAALVAGVAAGATAMFLSKKENRVKTKKVLQKAEKKVVAVAKEAKKDPKKFAKKVRQESRAVAQKVVKQAKRDVAVVQKKAKTVEKVVKIAKAASKSPAIKKVGKSLRKKSA